ncbi:RNA methyltransferase [Hugenholtzia roseola]|uniref:RNA methyltransferase n=1 Tax=Hugenholtzia roseola TaxID=1002 RepID=UPI0004171F1C|nr:RNA methyltransferase [Hugenholtzia roseola]
MLSKNQIKKIRGLQLKKNRQAEGLFLVEGAKILEELLATANTEDWVGTYQIDKLWITEQFASKNKRQLDALSTLAWELADEQSLIQAGTLQSNNAGIATIRFLKPSLSKSTQLIEKEGLTLVLDDLKDPGNLGTIIRLADWYGIKQLFCSPETVDCFNPKVVAASMGSLFRVQIQYCDLSNFLAQYKNKIPIYAAVLKGQNVHHTPMAAQGLLLIGSESHGVNPDLLPLVDVPLTIPRFGKAESLNAAIATAILIDNWRKGV